MEQLFRKKMWNGGGKKVIDRVWRKISFDCKSNPFLKMRIHIHKNLWNHCELIISTQLPRGFGCFANLENSYWYLKRIEMGQCHSLSKEMGGPDPKWTTCPHCETRVLTRVVFETYGCSINFRFCFIPYKCTGKGKLVLHTCPKCNYVIGKYN